MSATLERTGPGSSARVRQVTDFAELSAEIQSHDLLRRRYGYYWTMLVGTVLVHAGMITAVVLLGDTWWQLAVAALYAVVFTQTAFLGHDAAHRQIFRSGRWNEWTSLVLANLLVGLSYGWWQHKHTRHHGNPNKAEVDPDIDLPVLAFTPDQAAARRSRFGKWFATRQGWFFFPLLLLEGLELHFQAIRRVVSRERITRRWIEILFLVIRLGGFATLIFASMSPGKATAFLAVQLSLFGLYMGGSFAPNHKGMPIVPKELKVDFLRRQVLMSRNVSGSQVIDIAMGGLNYQIEHHLFPSMPRPSLRRAKPIVEEFCARKGVSYTEMTLMESYSTVVRYLNQVGLKGQRDNYDCPLVQTYRG